MSELAEIRALQFTNLEQANTRLLAFFRAKLPFEVTAIQIRPLAVSLNSVNGFLDLGKQRLFFKAHIESQVAGREYYNTEVLADAGYPILKPVLKATESAAQHVMLYDIVESPTMFDACRAVELGQATNADHLIKAQQNSDGHLLGLYKNSLKWATAEEHAQSPIHQLFYYRLTGGRLTNFYLGKPAYERLARLHWTINGVEYPHTLEELIARAIDQLNPAKPGAVVAGHGDAHNGNVFYLEAKQDLLYFDPAFAGHHSPLLDLVKPLYHNVHAQWMYFPEETAAQLNLTMSIANGRALLEHNFPINPIRQATHDSKTNLVLGPLLKILEEKNWLAPDWKAYMQSALMCCPLLTMNLCDEDKFPLNVSLLGFAHAVVMGHSDPLN